MGCSFISSLLLIVLAGIVVGNIYGPLYGFITGFGLLILYAIIIYLQHWWVDIRGLEIDKRNHEKKKKEYLKRKEEYLEQRKAQGKEVDFNVNHMLKVQPGDRIEMLHHSHYDIEPGAKGVVTKIRKLVEEDTGIYDLEWVKAVEEAGMSADDFKWVYVDWDKDWGRYSDSILIAPLCEDRFEILE